MYSSLKRFFWGEDPIGVLPLGLDAAGKSTLLYTFQKNHNVVVTIPFIGMCIEETTIQKVRLKSWDLGGCGKLPWGIMPNFWQGTEALVFCVDSNDRDRVEAARQEMEFYTLTPDLQHLPVLVLANKQDLPNALSPEELEKGLALAQQCKGRPYRIIGCSLTISMARAVEGLDWLRAIVQANRKVDRMYFVAPTVEESLTAKRAREEAAARALQKPVTAATLDNSGAPSIGSADPGVGAASIAACLEGGGKDEEELDDAVFLNKFRTHSLDLWDHRTHLRIAWAMLRLHGLEKGPGMIADGIREYIAQSKKGRSFHATMTAFWIRVVAHTMSEAQPGADFRAWLSANPELCDKNYPLRYYSAELLFRNETARSEVVAPDLKPLPEVRGLSPLGSL